MDAFERLSALDQSFLSWETPSTHMHVASALVFEAGPVRTPEGGIDLAAIRGAIEASLDRVPRYRQKLAWIPLEGRGVWVDDPRFRLEDHVRHLALPRSGGEEDLKRLASWLMSQPLDRGRPLWEMWVVEGLPGERFAIVSKVHHCMIDGLAGVELLRVLLSPDAGARPQPSGGAWQARPTPSGAVLLRDEVWRRLTLPLRAARDLPAVPREARDVARDLATRTRALTGTLVRTLRPASRTPLNGPVGPRRRVDWLRMDLDAVRTTARSLGCTVNDAVLTTVAGAMRRTLSRAGLDPGSVRFRALAPVSLRRKEEQGVLGNRVSLWLVDLPVGEADPLRRLRAVREETTRLKASGEALGAKLLTDVAEWTSSTLLSVAARAATRVLPFNIVVTNVPGPQIPLYLCGARLLETYPQAPLFENVGLSIALMSHDGVLCWGINADDALVPDTRAIVGDLERSWQALQRAAERGRRRPGRPESERSRRGAPAAFAQGVRSSGAHRDGPRQQQEEQP